MRFGLRLREVVGSDRGLERRLLDGILGSGTDTTSSAGAVATPDGGLLGGITGNGKDKPSVTSAPAAISTPTPGDGKGLGGAVGGLLGGPPSDGGLLDVGIGPSTAPLLSVGVAPTSGPLIGAGVGPASSPILSVGVAPPATTQPAKGGDSSTASSPSPPKTTQTSAVLPNTASSKAAASTPPSTQPSTPLPSSSKATPSTVPETSIVQAQPSEVSQTTLLTSITAAADNAPSTTTSSITSVATGIDSNGISSSKSTLPASQSQGTNVWKIVIPVAAAVGGLAVAIALVFVIRRLFRKRRLGKAEFPPSSPLLPPMQTSSLRDSFLPPRIARNISQRSKASSNGSVDLGSNGRTVFGGANIEPLTLGTANGGFTADRNRPLTPLPSIAEGGAGKDGWRPNQR